jgi:hypothetical protein
MLDEEKSYEKDSILKLEHFEGWLTFQMHWFGIAVT